MKTLRLRGRGRPLYRERIAALESLATYPIGEDFFQLNHGDDYFAFFDRLGEVDYFVVCEGERVVGVCCGILRRVPDRLGGPLRRAWYACDLKVHPDYRGRRIPIRIANRAFLLDYLRCPRGYAITMNPVGGPQANRVLKIADHWWNPTATPAQLLIYSVDAEAMGRLRPGIERERGPVSFLSLGGVKDVVLQSTGQPMPLLHVQWGALGAGNLQEPQADHVHMFCAPEGGALAQVLAEAGVEAFATATVLSHRMSRCDWSFVLTSEI